MIVIDGKSVSSKIYDNLKPRIETLKDKSINPGLAVIIVGNKFGITKNPLRYFIPKKLYSICYNEEDFLKQINNFSKLKIVNYFKKVNIKKRILNKYFLETKSVYMKNFFN